MNKDMEQKSQKPLSKVAMMAKEMEEFCTNLGWKVTKGKPQNFTISFKRHAQGNKEK